VNVRHRPDKTLLNMNRSRNLNVLLISTYDLGHQPFGLASPAAWLRREGATVRCVDLAVEELSDSLIASADLAHGHAPGR
jgi:hypothetical protein